LDFILDVQLTTFLAVQAPPWLAQGCVGSAIVACSLPMAETVNSTRDTVSGRVGSCSDRTVAIGGSETASALWPRAQQLETTTKSTFTWPSMVERPVPSRGKGLLNFKVFDKESVHSPTSRLALFPKKKNLPRLRESMPSVGVVVSKYDAFAVVTN
jgi:hypothetical protein